ncbi:MAG TPA: T9SS type A sorting domain-containing protein [Bacteroidia bacterium]|nr:T9SS type A sorting domain-containing protein [Bacteroidia bacterium]
MKTKSSPLSSVMPNLFRHLLLSAHRGMLLMRKIIWFKSPLDFCPVSMTVLACVMLCASTATAQTNVSGFISANTTWNLVGSPYVVVGNTILSSGYTLAIDPGVVVKFDSAKALQIDGELIAVGTAANRITFTSNRPVPAAGDWAKIQFTGLSTGAVFDTSGNYLSGSIMKYCDVLYGGQAGAGAVYITTASLYVSCCRINYSAAAGISCGGFVKTDSTSVRNSTGAGIIMSGMSSPYCPYTITYDTLEYNAGGGINGNINFPNCTNRVVKVSNCYFRFNSGLGALFNLTGQTALIRENEFINNSAGSSDGAAITRGSGNSIIECNLFLNNQSSVSAIEIGGDQNDTIRNNRFEGNVSSLFGSLIHVFVSCCGKKVISDNYFLNNSSSGGRLLFLHGWASGNDITQFFVSGNEFNNGQSNSEIYLYASSGNPALQFADISNNNFISDSAQYIINNYSAFSGPSMNADSNYWNSSSTQHIDSMIYDFFDNSNYSVVYYNPILSSPVVIDTACPVIITGINSIVYKETVSLFPNPFTTHATIKFPGTLHLATFRLYNLYGQLVQEKNNINGESFQLNRETLGSGVYVYEVTEKGKKICGGKAVVY